MVKSLSSYSYSYIDTQEIVIIYACIYFTIKITAKICTFRLSVANQASVGKLATIVKLNLYIIR